MAGFCAAEKAKENSSNITGMILRINFFLKMRLSGLMHKEYVFIIDPGLYTFRKLSHLILPTVPTNCKETAAIAILKNLYLQSPANLPDQLRNITLFFWSFIVGALVQL